MSKTFTIPVKYVFEGTFTIKADSLQDAVEAVNNNCSLVLGGNIHTTLDDDEVDWDFNIHPETIISEDPDEIMVEEDEETFGIAYFHFKLPHDMTPEKFVEEINEADYSIDHPLIQHTEIDEIEYPHVQVKAFFECDQTEDAIDEIASEAEYHFGHMEHPQGEWIGTYVEHQSFPKSSSDPLSAAETSTPTLGN